MLLFFIRHGDPVYNPDSLTPLGKRQAEAVSKRLALYGIDEIYASTSKRAHDTAVPTSEITKNTIIPLDFCNEQHAWKQLTVKKSDGKSSWCFQYPPFISKMNDKSVHALANKWDTHEIFENTSIPEGMNRINVNCDEFLSGLGYVHERENYRYKVENDNNKRIALFAHQGFGLAFISSLLDIPYPLFSTRFDMGHTGMTVIEFKNCDGYCIPKVLEFSCDSHIYKEGLPTNYQNILRF